MRSSLAGREGAGASRTRETQELPRVRRRGSASPALPHAPPRRCCPGCEAGSLDPRSCLNRAATLGFPLPSDRSMNVTAGVNLGAPCVAPVQKTRDGVYTRTSPSATASTRRSPSGPPRGRWPKAVRGRTDRQGDDAPPRRRLLAGPGDDHPVYLPDDAVLAKDPRGEHGPILVVLDQQYRSFLHPVLAFPYRLFFASSTGASAARGSAAPGGDAFPVGGAPLGRASAASAVAAAATKNIASRPNEVASAPNDAGPAFRPTPMTKREGEKPIVGLYG